MLAHTPPLSAGLLYGVAAPHDSATNNRQVHNEMSFRAKILLGIALLQAVLMVGLLWAGLSFIGHSYSSQVRIQAASAAALAAAVARDGVAGRDLPDLDFIARELAQFPGVVYVSIRAEDGSVLAQAGERADLEHSAIGELPAPDVVQVSAAVRQDRDSLGRVELGYSAAGMGGAIASFGGQGVVIGALGIAAVTLLLAWVGVYLSHRLLRLDALPSQSLAEHGPGGLGRLATPPKTSKKAASISVEASSAQPTGATLPGSRGRILLVEDGAANQMVVAAMLRKAGYGVDTADNGRAAVQSVEALGYDAVLMDIGLPELSGPEATRAIRRLAQGRGRMPIIALTASSAEEEREQCLAAGMNDVLAKPIDAAALTRSLDRWLSSRAPDEAQSVAEIDEAALQRLVAETGPEVLPAIIRVFLDELQSRLKYIAEAARGADYSTLRDQAHVLKSSAGTFGAVELQQLARALDEACVQGDLQRAESLAERLPAEAARASEALASRFPEV